MTQPRVPSSGNHKPPPVTLPKSPWEAQTRAVSVSLAVLAGVGEAKTTATPQEATE